MNDENLIRKEDRTPSERREIARKAGIASGRARRAKRELKECLNELLEKEYSGSDGKTMSGAELISVRLFMKARDGDIKAFEVLRDTVGQKPVERVSVDRVDPATRAEMEALLGLNG